MKLTALEAILVDVPTTRVHRLSFGAITAQNYVIVRAFDEEGRVGLGEASTIGGPAWGEESTETIKLIIDTYLTPRLLGRDPRQLRRLGSEMGTWVKGNRFAKAAVEMALLDLVARRAGLPAVQLLGGVVQESIELAWTLASGDTQTDIEEGEAKLAQRRHRVFKLKIGYGEPAADVAHVSQIARHFEGRARIQVDVNQAWDELTATRCIAKLQDAGVALVEQPVARHDLRAMQRLAARFDLAIMADESLATPADALEIVRQEAADVLALKLTKSGGPFAALQCAAIAQAAGLPLYGGCMLETGVGTAAYLHTFAAMGGMSQGCELFGPLLLKEDIIKEPLQYRDFAIHLHEGLGFGVELDPEKLQRYRRPGQ
jgi:muconate cycloisomerase